MPPFLVRHSLLDRPRIRVSNAPTGFTTKKNTAAAIATRWMTSVMNAP